MALVQLANGGFKYPDSNRWVFRAIDLNVSAGETVQITGRNGSGKTTLLKTLAKLLPLSEGSLELTPGARSVYMDQTAGHMLAPDLTIEEHFMAFSDTESSRLDRSPEQVLNDFEVGLVGHLSEFVGHLSGGQKQIVALLSVLQQGASLICLDEFVSSLDPTATKVAINILRHVARQGRVALVVVSHLDGGLAPSRSVAI